MAAAWAWTDHLEETADLIAKIEMPLHELPSQLMQHGRFHALLARGYRQRMATDDVDRLDLINPHVGAALDSLQRAHALGHFASAKRRHYLETSPELDELRDHPEFEMFLWEKWLGNDYMSG